MAPRDDSTSLGAILLEMGAITPEQLESALEYQERSSLEQKLGAILHHLGFCSGSDIEAALSVQKSLRDAKGPVKKALVVADIAIQRRLSNGERSRAIECAQKMVRSSTGTEYPAVTSEMLAKSRG